MVINQVPVAHAKGKLIATLRSFEKKFNQARAHTPEGKCHLLETLVENAEKNVWLLEDAYYNERMRAIKKEISKRWPLPPKQIIDLEMLVEAINEPSKAENASTRAGNTSRIDENASNDPSNIAPAIVAKDTNDLPNYIQKRLKELCKNSDIYPHEYQLAHDPLDKNANLNAIETYLQELKNVKNDYKAMSRQDPAKSTSTGLETCQEYIKLQNQVILDRLEADLAIWKKQLKDLKKLLHSSPSLLSATDSTAYSEVCAAVDRLKPATMDTFLREIKASLQAQEDEAARYFPKDDFQFNIEEAIAILTQAVGNNQIGDIPFAYRLALKHLLYILTNRDMPSDLPNHKCLASYGEVDQLLTQMATATQIIQQDHTADKSFSSISSKSIVTVMTLFGGPFAFLSLKNMENMKKQQTLPEMKPKSNLPPPNNPLKTTPQKLPSTYRNSSLPPSNNPPKKTAQSPAGRFSWKALSRRTQKGTALTAGALVTLGVGYQIYKKFFSKEEEATTTPVPPEKSWLTLMLLLLLCGLLGASALYRKKPHA